MIDRDAADESGATREPLCGKCGLTRGTLIHRPAEFSDDPGAEDCHRFVTGEFVEGEPQPVSDPRAGKELGGCGGVADTCDGCIDCLGAGRPTREELLAKIRDCEAEHPSEPWAAELEARCVKAEEARRLAEQERDEMRHTLKLLEGKVDYPAEQVTPLRAEVERLQGELAGLREVGRRVYAHMLQTIGCYEECEVAIVLKAALAPQEGAEKGTKG